VENSANPTLEPATIEIEKYISILDYMIQIKRQKNQFDSHKDITNEERDIMLKQALNTYKLLQERTLRLNGRILVEYHKGLHKIVEEVIL
jgi:hypothetical protein